MYYEGFIMNNLKKRRTSVLIGLALMGLSVHAYAADVTATTDTPTTVASTEANGASESQSYKYRSPSFLKTVHNKSLVIHTNYS